MLERFCFYGVRGIVVLFAVDTEGLNLPHDEVFPFYSVLAIIMVLLPVPLSWITDKYLGQKRAMTVGGFISLIGYVILMLSDFTSVLIGLALVVLGVSLIKPSSMILLARLFRKNEKERDLAFVFVIFCINIGAFLGVFLIGLIGEKIGWKEGFSVAAFISFLYNVLFYFSKNSILEIETNEIKYQSNFIVFNTSIKALFFLLFINSTFWFIHGDLSENLNIELTSIVDSNLFGIQISKYFIDPLISGVSFLIKILLFVFCYFKKKLSVQEFRVFIFIFKFFCFLSSISVFCSRQ